MNALPRFIPLDPIDEPTYCWGCEYVYEPDEFVDLGGLPFCGPCAAIEVGDDGRPDRWRDL